MGSSKANSRLRICLKWLRRIVERTIYVALAVIVTLWLVRAFNARSAPDLRDWHRPLLSSEFRARDFPEGATFAQYANVEQNLKRELNALIDSGLAGPGPTTANRYAPGSPVNPDRFSRDWNRSYELRAASPRGAAVLLHGASDSPYSMRAIALALQEAGLHSVAIRLPGNGTIPGELTKPVTEDWIAAARVGIDHARSLIEDGQPLYIVGYSMGGALALNYALRSATDPSISAPAGLILVSPAIAVTPFAAFAGWDILLSRLPYFEQFAWVDIRPEYEPFKYNSFPKQVGDIGYRLTTENAELISALVGTEQWANMAPMLTFMSVVDATVGVNAVLDTLYRPVEAAGSSLVLFGVNRTNAAMGFLKQDFTEELEALASDPDRRYDLTLVSNVSDAASQVAAFHYCVSGPCPLNEPLDLNWPRDVFSLSHVALPFAPDDPIYGATPGPLSPGDFTLGSLQPRGERDILVIPMNQFMRLRYNPFMDYLLRRIIEFCHICEQ